MKYLIYTTSHNGSTVVNHYWSTGGFITKPSDSPANQEYEGRIMDPGNWETHLFQSRRTRGRSESSAGVVELNNADGGLNGIWTHGWGRPILIYSGPDSAKLLSDYTLLATNTVVSVERVGRTKLRLVMQDLQSLIAAKKMNATKYLGTNSGPTGVEGLATDIKGKPKPTLWGDVAVLNPIPVNDSKRTYQVRDAHALALVLNSVSDSGAPLTFEANYASLALLTAASVTATKYAVSVGSASEGAYFRLGSDPAGVVTCSATIGSAGDRTVAQVIKQILKGPCGLSDSDLDLASFTALDTACSWQVGYYTGDSDETVGEVLDKLCESIGAYWYITAEGKVSVGKFAVPLLIDSVLSITQEDILTEGFEVSVPGDYENGTPPWRIIVEYGKNFYVFSDSDFAGTVTQAQRQPLLQEYLRTDPADDTTLHTKHPLSEEFVATTLLRSLSNANSFRTELATMYGTEREIAVFPLSAETASTVQLNDVIDVTDDFFVWSSTPFRVIGRIHEYVRNRIVLICWK